MSHVNPIPGEIPLPKPLPWCKFPTELLDSCKDGKIVEPMHKRAMVQTVASWMMNVLKDTGTETARLVARSICAKHPQSFALYLADEEIADGVESLVKALSNRAAYLVDLKKKAGKPPGTVTSKKPTKSSSTSSGLDTYGTVACQPGLPPDETIETQEQKKTLLITEYAKMTSGRDQAQIDDAMKRTYPSQRMAIFTRKSKLIGEVLDDWPFLRESVHFFKHASQLLGKVSIYNDFVKNVAKNFTIHDYMQFFINVQKKKLKNKMTDKLTKLQQILSQSNGASKSLNQPFPQAVALIPLLLTYFEEENTIYELVEKTTSDEDVLALIDTPTPVAVIKGESLYAKEVECVVVIEQRIIFRCEKVMTSILIVCLSYFVFGLKFPATSQKTLEFIQRAFLSINTPGSKAVTGKKRKRGVSDVDTSVFKLINTLNKYWTTDAD